MRCVTRAIDIVFVFLYGNDKNQMHLTTQVEVMVEERIEKQLKAQKVDTRSSVDMKDEIRLLWAEMDALVKSRQEMQGHIEHLTSVAQKAQEHASREHEMLKSENGYLRKQLQSLKNEGVQVSHLLAILHLITPCCVFHEYSM
jgi:uncharacterized coiled-coil DUF342 family protein